MRITYMPPRIGSTRPRFVSDYFTDSTVTGSSVKFSQTSVAVLTSCVQCANFLHIFPVQNSLTVLFPGRGPAFYNHISHIFGLRPKPKMFWIYAFAVAYISMAVKFGSWCLSLLLKRFQSAFRLSMFRLPTSSLLPECSQASNEPCKSCRPQ